MKHLSNMNFKIQLVLTAVKQVWCKHAYVQSLVDGRGTLIMMCDKNRRPWLRLSCDDRISIISLDIHDLRRAVNL